MKIKTIQNIDTGEYLTTYGTFTSNQNDGLLVRVQTIGATDEYDGTLNGLFNTDFPYLGRYQIGNCQGDVRANATYQYIKCGDQDLITQNTKCVGTAFDTITKEIDLGKNPISAKIDINSCLSTSSTSPECILAIGQDVSSFGDNICMFIFAYKLSGVCHIIIQYVDELYSDITHRRDITVQNGIVDILIDQDRIMICGQDRKLDLDYDVRHTLGHISDVSSFTLQTDYAHIIRKTIASSGSSNSKVNIVDGGYSPAGRQFSKTVQNNLDHMSIYADIDLTTCISGKNENILSIGTDITQWGTSASNLHIYYNGSTLELDAVDKDHPSAQLRVRMAVDPSVIHIILTNEGLYYGNIQIFDATNSIIKSLRTVSQIQIGSCEGAVRSNATYQSMYYLEQTYSTTDIARDQAFNGIIDRSDLKDLSISFSTADCQNMSTLFQFNEKGKTIFLVKYICRDGDYVYLSVLLKTSTRSTEEWLYPITCEYKIPYLDTLVFDLQSDGMIVNASSRIYLEYTMPYLSAKSSGKVKLKRGIFGGYSVDRHGRFIEGDDLYPPQLYTKSYDSLYDNTQYIKDNIGGFLVIAASITSFGDKSIREIKCSHDIMSDGYTWGNFSIGDSFEINSIDKNNHLCINRRQSGSADINNPCSGTLPTIAKGFENIRVRICDVDSNPIPQ